MYWQSLWPTSKVSVWWNCRCLLHMVMWKVYIERHWNVVFYFSKNIGHQLSLYCWMLDTCIFYTNSAAASARFSMYRKFISYCSCNDEINKFLFLCSPLLTVHKTLFCIMKKKIKSIPGQYFFFACFTQISYCTVGAWMDTKCCYFIQTCCLVNVYWTRLEGVRVF